MDFKNPREIIKDLISQYIRAKPEKISLELYWEGERSTININENNLNQTLEHPQTMDFTSFADGVHEAHREAYGDLEVVPISFTSMFCTIGLLGIFSFSLGMICNYRNMFINVQKTERVGCTELKKFEIKEQLFINNQELKE